ncbi:MAG: CPBP family intramembrane metalloprotease [Deltaproteobacteria bacterium]|nr:CPBP family intramembrane metalloprotease [Deltaproteobacteria bacterium]
MTIPSEPRTPRLYHAGSGPAFSVLGAVGLVAAALGSFLLAAGIVVGAGGSPVVAVIVAELTFVAVAVVGLVMHPLPVAALGLVVPARRYVGAAMLIGSSAWYLNLNVIDLLPLPEGGVETLQDIVDGPHLIVAVLALAVLPAICEELIFRGILVRSLATRFAPTLAVLISALVFAGYHLSVIQLIPTFTLGVLAGVLTVRSHSVIPAMTAHLINNAMAILISRDVVPGASGWIDAHRAPSLAIAGALTMGGITILVGKLR